MKGHGDDMGSFSMISWSIWLNRNAFLYEAKFLSSFEVISRACSLWAQFLQCQPVAALKNNSICSPSQWLVPPSGRVKINVDAVVSQGGLRVGLGVVARDDQGLVL